MRSNYKIAVPNEKQKVKEFLAEQVAFYEKIASGLDALILIFDVTSMKISWANDNFYRVLGHDMQPGKTLDQNSVLDLYHPDDRDYLRAQTSMLLSNPNKGYTAFYRFKNARGDYLWFYSASRVFRIDEDRDIFETITISVDFTGPLSYTKNMKLFAQEKLRDINAEVIRIITKRERHILQYFARGFKTKEIADELGISFHTVNNHRKNMLKKLQLKNLSSLVNFAVENGLN